MSEQATELTPEQLAAKKEAEKQAAAEEKKAAAEAKKLEKAAEREAAKKAKDEQKAKEKADKEAAKLAKAQAAEEAKAAKAASRVEKNGIVRPMTGATKKVWDIADAISAETKAPAERAAVIERAKAEGINEGTINTQYGRWRKYHGLVTLRDQNAEKKAQEKAQRDAEKKAKKEAEAKAKAEEAQ